MADKNNIKKILVVEDEKPLLMVIKAKLEMAGYKVFAAEDGEAGEQAAIKFKPDLMLLDILLPKKDGFEVLESLRAKKIAIPVLVISNSGQNVEIDKALKLGARDYLVKADFSPNEVLAKVEEIIGPTQKKQKSQKFDSRDQLVSSKNGSVEANKGELVLIVEDDKFLREIISQKLLKEGFDVLSAIDSADAMRILEEKTPRIILLDLILPGMDGFEFLDRLKKNPATNSVPVIVLSNLGQKEDIDRAIAAGAVDYLIKADYNPADIVSRVRQVLSKKYV